MTENWCSFPQCPLVSCSGANIDMQYLKFTLLLSPLWFFFFLYVVIYRNEALFSNWLLQWCLSSNLQENLPIPWILVIASDWQRSINAVLRSQECFAIVVRFRFRNDFKTFCSTMSNSIVWTAVNIEHLDNNNYWQIFL